MYKFTIINQEGTLWWHAHALWLRATVHGALIIYPKSGKPYPFDKPHREYPIILGNKASYVLWFLLFFPKFKSFSTKIDKYLKKKKNYVLKLHPG